jgi:predicted O-methyltransferase YrrM
MLNTLDIGAISREYQANKSFYTRLTKNIKKKISGRICHHRVCVLNLLCKLNKVERYLEIGVHNGTSMSYVVSENSNPKHCIGIDFFGAIGHYKKDKLTKERSRSNIKGNNTSESKIGLIKGNSKSKKVIAELCRHFDYESVDLLFIDGDHSYAGVKADFENYSKFVRPGGWIVLDDYMPHKDNWPGICKFVHKDLDFTKFSKVGIFLNTELVLRKIEN